MQKQTNTSAKCIHANTYLIAIPEEIVISIGRQIRKNSMPTLEEVEIVVLNLVTQGVSCILQDYTATFKTTQQILTFMKKETKETLVEIRKNGK